MWKNIFMVWKKKNFHIVCMGSVWNNFFGSMQVKINSSCKKSFEMQKMDGSTFQKYFIKSGRNKESKKENIVVSFCRLILNF